MDKEIQDIGKRLRTFRREKKMTLRGLGRMAGCSESLLSKIENNRVDPSLKTLHGITTALGVPISALFAEPEAPKVCVAGRSGRSCASRPGRTAAA